MSALSYIKSLHENGKYSFTKQDVLGTLSSSEKVVEVALSRLKKSQVIFSPCSNFYVIIPSEYKNRGEVPYDWYIDHLMKFANRNYYVSLLNAAAIHGASHQQPMGVQVVVDRLIRPKTTAASNIKFIQHKDIAPDLVDKIKTKTGYMNVSSIELTILDLVRHHNYAGYLDNASLAMKELSENLSSEKLYKLLEASKDIANIRRLGYIFKIIGQKQYSDLILSWLEKKVLHLQCITLDIYQKSTLIRKDDDFKILINDEIELDYDS